MMRRAAPAVLGAAVLIGCSSGPEELTFDKPLPGCDAIAGVLAGQGMTSPSPQPAGSSGPTSVNCSLVTAPGTQPPAVTSAIVYLYRPARDTFDGKPTPGWASGFDADNQCAGTAAADTTLPGGRSCYSPTAAGGQGKVTGYTDRTGVSVLIIWSNPDAGPETLRTETLAKAGAIASAVTGML